MPQRLMPSILSSFQ